MAQFNRQLRRVLHSPHNCRRTHLRCVLTAAWSMAEHHKFSTNTVGAAWPHPPPVEDPYFGFFSNIMSEPLGSKKLLASVRMYSDSPEKVSNPHVQIRVATPEDSLHLSVFARKCFYDTFDGTTSDENLREYLASAFSDEIQLQEILDTRSTILLATSTDSPIERGNAGDKEGQKEVWLGYGRVIESEAEDCVTGPDPKIELQRLYIDRSDTRGGIGSKLMAASM